MNEAFKQLHEFLSAHSSYAVVCHRRPDGDAYGSTLSMRRYLLANGKKARAYCFDEMPYYLSFLPDSSEIILKIDSFWRAEAEAIVAVDCGDKHMIGIDDAQFPSVPLAVIDHHASNLGFGDCNVIKKDASATAQVIKEYFDWCAFAPDKEIATHLFTGIYTDTDAFSNLGTTPLALQAASQLLIHGAQFREITANTIQNKSIASLKLWGRALERLRLDTEKGIAVTVLYQKDIDECKARAEDTEGIAGLLNHLSDVKMSLVLKEQSDGIVKGSLRTTSDRVDVSKIASLMGGGGHAKAAGFTIRGRIVETDRGWKIEKN